MMKRQGLDYSGLGGGKHSLQNTIIIYCYCYYDMALRNINRYLKFLNLKATSLTDLESLRILKFLPARVTFAATENFTKLNPGVNVGQNTTQPNVSVVVFLSDPSVRMLHYIDPNSFSTNIFHPYHSSTIPSSNDV
jgi:hypothetical protein